ADNLRAYLLFCGPWEEGGDFTDRDLQGVVRFTGRLYSMIVNSPVPDGPGADLRRLDKAVHKVGTDIERLKFNTAIAEIMSLSNWLRDGGQKMTPPQWAQACRTLVLLLAPFEPFMAEELWRHLGGGYSVHSQPWPGYDPGALVDDEIELPVQVNGKLRGKVTVLATADQQAALAAALALAPVTDALAGGTPKRVVFVPGRTLNRVTWPGRALQLVTLAPARAWAGRRTVPRRPRRCSASRTLLKCHDDPAGRILRSAPT